MKTLAERVWSKVNKHGPVVRPELGSCWLWTGSQNSKGRGVIVLKKSRPRVAVLAHRVSYELEMGTTPGDMCVCHKCDVPLCVRPDHLFLGTKADNNADMRAKGRQARGQRHWHSRLTEEQVMELRRRSRDGETIVSVARELGLPMSASFQAARGATWKHLPMI